MKNNIHATPQVAALDTSLLQREINSFQRKQEVRKQEVAKGAVNMDKKLREMFAGL